MKRLTLISLIAALGGALPSAVSAQGAALDDSLATAGLVTTSQVSGSPWAWLLIQPARLDLVTGRSFAVYRKSGPASSANPFTRLGVISQTVDDSVIASLETRAAHVGGDMNALGGSLTGIFRQIASDASIPVPARLAAVIAGSVGRPEHESTLLLLVRRHPLAAMAAGLAHASPMPPGVHTFEVREFDTVSSDDLRVIGRVTLDTNSPLVLPAPGQPYQVTAQQSAQDHLNIRLRWASPPELRRAALLQYGFDVFRIPKTVADGLSINPAAPSLEQLLQLVDDGDPATGLRVNASPILPTRLYDTGNVSLPGDDTIYILDDNRRNDSFAAPFNNGDQFYYFAIARDLLGRPGQPSPGLLVTVCDRYRPQAPFGIAVTAHESYNETTNTEVRGLDIQWKPVVDANSSISAYYVYRWERTQDVHTSASDPQTNRIGIVQHAAGTQTYHFIDTGAMLVANPGRTYFYTVRALDGGACAGGNLSVNSGPVPGTLRDHGAPDAPTGSVVIVCQEPEVTFVNFTTLAEAGASVSDPPVDFVCTASGDGAAELAWAEFKTLTDSVGIVPFQADGMGGYVARLRAVASKTTPSCRVGTRSGHVSAFVAGGNLPPVVPGTVTIANFMASVTPLQVEAGSTCGGGHLLHDPATGATNEVCLFIETPASAVEYRVYRQVDGGEPSLINRGQVDAGGDDVEVKDGTLPAAATVCYYVQAVDRDGNISVMAPVGDCIDTISPQRLPVPVLDTLEGAGNGVTPKMRISWHCSPYGVRRFEVWIASHSGSSPGVAGSGLEGDLATVHPFQIMDIGALDFRVYETVRLELIENAADGFFEYEVDVAAGETYTVLVRAVGPGVFPARPAGEFSERDDFTWITTPTVAGADVPWPPQGWPQPRPVSDFHDKVIAQQLPDLPGWEGAVGIRIGEYRYNGSKYIVPSSPGPFGGTIHTLYEEHRDPHTALYRNPGLIPGDESDRTSGSMLPCVIYRHRIVENSRTDVVQVSPLMESMAYGFDTAEGSSVTVVHDPFIAAVKKPGIVPADEPNFELFLVDHSPVIAGARYRYIIVRFASDGEMRQSYTLETAPIVP